MTGRADPHRWARIADLFDRALSVRDADRDAWLIAICGDDALMHDEVSALLRVHEQAGHWLSGPAGHGRERPLVARGPTPAPDHAASQPPHRSRDARGLGVSQPGPPQGAAPTTSPIGPYRIIDILGEGGMGVVYRAEDSRLGRMVALKAVAGVKGDNSDRVARLRREARAAAALAHPNIATVYSLEEADGQIYMASELVPGGTLRDELDSGPLPVVRAIDAALAVARAAGAAHAKGIVHRDLKPENVAVAPDGQFKVLDFGLAAAMVGGFVALTDDLAVVGTPGYMSPEHIRQQRVDGRSDQFAIGVLLYELVTGRHPFVVQMPAATLARILDAQPDPLSKHLPDAARLAGDEIIGALEAIATRCLEKNPDDRFADTNALVGELERLRALAAPASERQRRGGARVAFWWQFHQAATTAGFTLLLLPLWRLRAALTSPLDLLLPLAAVVAVVVAGALRLHLWFAMREYPDQWHRQDSRARRWILAADLVLALALLTTGVMASARDLPGSAFLVAAAAAITVVTLVVEPATTRAARVGDISRRT